MKNLAKQKNTKKEFRRQRTRKKLRQISARPRLSVFRSNKHIYAQLIDDQQGKTLASSSDQGLKIKGTKQALASKVGELIAKKCLDKNIKQVVFDKGHYKYHGRIAALAAGARKAGLNF